MRSNLLHLAGSFALNGKTSVRLGETSPPERRNFTIPIVWSEVLFSIQTQTEISRDERRVKYRLPALGLVDKVILPIQTGY